MAVAEDFTTQTSGADGWVTCADSAMAVVTGSLSEAPFGPAVAAIERYRDELNALEALHIAKRQQAGFTDRSTEGIIKGSGKVSKGEAKKRTKRGEAVKKNPALADKLSNGTLSTEKIDLIADAAAKTGGVAASDPGLIKDLAESNPDQGKSITRKYVDEHETSADRSDRHQWQRRGRKAYKGRSAAGRAQLIIEGDDLSVDAALKKIRQRADVMYRGEGGRDVPGGEHERTHDQRMFDAAIAQLLGDASNDPPPPTARPQNLTGDQSAAGDDADSDDIDDVASTSNDQRSAATAPTHAPPSSPNRPGQRPLMVFTGKLTDIADDPEKLAAWEAELMGSGTVPAEVASYYRCISDQAGMLLSGTGAPLWLGRTKRLITLDQWKALVVRDQGCVLCSADHTICEAHHIIPFESPAQGNSNIDEFAMTCSDCHHRVHDNNLTLFWDKKTLKWRLRAAKPDEISPKRRKPGPQSSTPSAPQSDRCPPPGPRKPKRQSVAETSSTATISAAPKRETTAESTGLDPHERETKHGILRHDLFDWIG